MAPAPEIPDLSALPSMIGPYTRRLLDTRQQVRPVAPDEALSQLAAEMTPQNERLVAYGTARFKVAPTASAVRERLQTASERKNLAISSANLSQWVPSRPTTQAKYEVNITTRNLLKLCLAMDLDLEESIAFTYDTLYQNWFNYRMAEDTVYLFILSQQSLFEGDALRRADEVNAWYKALTGDDSLNENSPRDCTGFTQTLKDRALQLLGTSYDGPDEAIAALKTHLLANRPYYTGFQRSARRTYRTYFCGHGASTITPLTELYRQQTGLSLPATTYLEGRDTSGATMAKRLLWGTDLRSAWREADPQNKSFDILRNDEIAIERHAVERMERNGVLRGNIIAVLFFHFCLENRPQLQMEGATSELFGRFYRRANLTLMDSCGMMPLHPRKPLDRLFLTALAKCGRNDPIQYLNQMLDAFYRSGL